MLPKTVVSGSHKEVSWEPCLPLPTCLLSTPLQSATGKTCCLPRPRPAGRRPSRARSCPPSNCRPRPPADQQFPAHLWGGSSGSKAPHNRVPLPPSLGQHSQTGARNERGEPSSPPLSPSPPSKPVVPVGCTVRKAIFPHDDAQRGVLLGFGTRRLCCLVCIRLTEPRLLGQPRAVRLDKNNC